MRTALEEYEWLVSSAMAGRGIRTTPTPASDHKYVPGDFLYLHREGVKHYTGPHLVASVDDKHIRIHIGDRTGTRSVNITQVRPARITLLQSVDEVLTADTTGPPRVLYTEVLDPGDSREFFLMM